MEIVVNDTNLFFDLLAVDLIDKFFSLPFDVHTTDFVISEVVEPEQIEVIERLIEEGKLTVFVSDFEIYSQIIEMNMKVRGLSLPDCSVWYYSKTNGYTLLTGDKLLRNTAIKDDVMVRGILYILDLMVETGVIMSLLAAEKLQLLLNKGSRLPVKECKRRIEKWSNA